VHLVYDRNSSRAHRLITLKNSYLDLVLWRLVPQLLLEAVVNDD